MKYRMISVIAVAVFALLVAGGPPARAQNLSGAIFTTVAGGSEVNYNHYASKDLVYLSGGPGPGAPLTAAGLPDGTYVFMVTDPSGKTLLSTDAAGCRQFVVTGGVAASVPAAPACQHQTVADNNGVAIDIQLMPYNDTPNKGGVYKAWVTPVGQYACALSRVDCNARGAKHGFVPANSKTDNFKVKATAIVEIDTRFFNDINHDGWQDPGENFLDDRQITWTDTVGGTNSKWSYLNTALDINHEAHVEAVETGTHDITVGNQAGCAVGLVWVDGVAGTVGPQTVAVNVASISTSRTYRVDVACEP